MKYYRINWTGPDNESGHGHTLPESDLPLMREWCKNLNERLYDYKHWIEEVEKADTTA